MMYVGLISIFAAVIVSLSVPALAEPQVGIPVKLKQFIERLDSEKNKLQGGAIAIIYKGQVVYKSAFGKQKGNTGLNTPSTLFPLASVSKAVSATAVALMVDQGRLNFDEKFNIKCLKHPVNLMNILGHTTGYQYSGNAQIEQGLIRKKLIDEILKQKPRCTPGKCYTYSNVIFSLIEEALNTKKMSLESVINNLRIALKTDGIQIIPLNPKMTVAYPHANGKQLPFPPYYPKAAPAAAGVFASLDGMIELFKLSFGYRPDLISQRTLDCIHKPIILNQDIDRWNIPWKWGKGQVDSYYGLGWRILKAKGHPRRDLIFHSGYIAGISTFIGFIPSEEIGIIILINQRSGVALKSSMNFWNELLK